MTTDTLPSISALILAGGRAQRMNGADKGLVTLNGQPMIGHVIDRLQPQLEMIRINANRHHDDYAALGFEVIADHLTDYQGPLAGMARGLESCASDWMLVVPCDTPYLPADLAERLYRAIERDNSELAVAHDGERLQPVICLLHRQLTASLLDFLATGDRKIDRWFAHHRISRVDFSDLPDAFININSLQDKQRLENGVV